MTLWAFLTRRPTFTFPYPRLSRAPIHSQQPVTALGRILEAISGGSPSLIARTASLSKAARLSVVATLRDSLTGICLNGVGRTALER